MGRAAGGVNWTKVCGAPGLDFERRTPGGLGEDVHDSLGVVHP